MLNLQVMDTLYGWYAFWHLRIKAFRVFYWLILFLSNPVHTIFTRNRVCVLHLKIYSVTVFLILPAPSVDPHSYPKWKLASHLLSFFLTHCEHESMVPCLHVPCISSSHYCFCRPRIWFHFVCDLSNWVLNFSLPSAILLISSLHIRWWLTVALDCWFLPPPSWPPPLPFQLDLVLYPSCFWSPSTLSPLLTKS